MVLWVYACQNVLKYILQINMCGLLHVSCTSKKLIDTPHIQIHTYTHTHVFYSLLHYHTGDFHCPKNLLCTTHSSFPSSLTHLKPLAITDLFAISIVSPFSRMSYGWNHRVCNLSYWFLLLSNRHLSFLHIFSWLDKSFLFTHCMDPFTYWKTSWSLALLAIINKVALNIHGQKFFFLHISFQFIWGNT